LEINKQTLNKPKDKKEQHTTRGIKNCRDSRLFKGFSQLQLLCNLTGNRPQSATFHTANRWLQVWKTSQQTITSKIERKLKCEI